MIGDNKQHLSQYGEQIVEKYKKVEDFRYSITYPLIKTKENPDGELADKFRFGIWNKKSELIGHIGLTADPKHPYTGNIGYYLAERVTGQGIASQALRTLTDYAFSLLGFTSLYAFVREDNSRSIKVLRRANYKKDFINRYTFEDREGFYSIYMQEKHQRVPRHLV